MRSPSDTEKTAYPPTLEAPPQEVNKELEVPTNRAPSTVPAKTLSVFVLLSTVLTGSLINSVPKLNDALTIDSVLNCTLPSDLLPSLLNNFSSVEGEAWTWLWPMLLPVAFIFVRDWNLQLDREKLSALYHHATGQVMSFSSTEIIRHFIVSPDDAFALKCNVSQSDCTNYKNVMTNVSQLCHKSQLPDREIFDSLHSIPNVTAALMGSSTIFLLCNLKSARQAVSPFLFEVHPACQNYKFCSRRLLKFFCLVGFVATAYYCLWQAIRTNKNSIQELAFSYAYGLAVQLTVLKTHQSDVTLPLVN